MSTSASLAAEVPVETVRERNESAPTMERVFDRYSVAGRMICEACKVGHQPGITHDLRKLVRSDPILCGHDGVAARLR